VNAVFHGEGLLGLFAGSSNSLASRTASSEVLNSNRTVASRSAWACSRFRRLHAARHFPEQVFCLGPKGVAQTGQLIRMPSASARALCGNGSGLDGRIWVDGSCGGGWTMVQLALVGHLIRTFQEHVAYTPKNTVHSNLNAFAAVLTLGLNTARV